MRWIQAHWQTILMVIILLLVHRHVKLTAYDKGEVAPNFSAMLIDQTPFELDELKGNYILLDFWASWCGPCRRDNPKVVGVYKEFEGKTFKEATGFEIVSVALERNPNSWHQAIEKDNLYWKYHTLNRTNDFDRISDIYKVDRIPTKYFIGPDGKIIGGNWSATRIRRYLNKRAVK